MLSISSEQNAQAVSVERNTILFGILATALIGGSAWIFTQLSNKVDAQEIKIVNQGLVLAGTEKEIQFLKSENSKLNQGLDKLQGENAKLKDRVLILEQKK